MSNSPKNKTLTLTPIGQIRTSMRAKFDAPCQPEPQAGERNLIELLPGFSFEQALTDLAGFDRIWLIWWFDRNSTWRPKVLPPRGPAKRRGLFATRSPHRPNPIGITAVELLEIKGRNIYVGSTDLVDGTPILDIKPYLRTADAFPEAKLGWIEELEEQQALPVKYRITFSTLAQEQLDWLKINWQIDFIKRACQLLERDPSPHRTRRITGCRDGLFRMSCGGWRVYFALAGEELKIEKISPGYPERLLKDPAYDRVPDQAAQLAFGEVWGNLSGSDLKNES